MSSASRRLIHIIVVLLCLPFAAAGALLPVNEYTAFDNTLAGAVDCDGPIRVLIFAGPNLIFYASNAVLLFLVRAQMPRWHISMSISCLIISLIVLPNTVRALVANHQNQSEPICQDVSKVG